MLKASISSGDFIANIKPNYVEFNITKAAQNAFVQVCEVVDFNNDATDYVLMPACAYNGNKFDSIKREYPPLFTTKEASIDMPVTITDVPRLEKDSSGIIEVTAGDLSVPCIGIYSRKSQKAMLLFTKQQYKGINFGFSYENGKCMVRWPFFREKQAYRWPFMQNSKDKGYDFKVGDKVIIDYKIFNFECSSMEQFYSEFFKYRKCMQMDDKRPAILPFSTQFNIQRQKFNTYNWYDECGFYGHTSKADNPKTAWQPGWCGGGISSYAFLKLGDKLEQERAIKTLEYVFKTQTESGFLIEATDDKGNVYSCGFGESGTENWHLVRESADVLFYIFKHFEVMRNKNIDIPFYMQEGARRLADAFVSLWDKYEQFGQFVDLKTGNIVVGGSTAGAIASAGLCAAYKWFNCNKYLEVAQHAAKLYYERDAKNGYTTGGPGEILQCPDSESCFGLLESLVVLYETTKLSHWLNKAKHVAHLCSSWIFPYNYVFLPNSEFSRLQMRTVGAIFANVQNKHAAPGICTLSGNSFYRLYKYTGDVMYKEIFEDIVLTVSQYMSTDNRPIISWDVPKDASLLEDDTITATREKLISGYMCERVNTSDWESERCIGGVFNGSCWCETTNLLILADSVQFCDLEKIKFLNNP